MKCMCIAIVVILCVALRSPACAEHAVAEKVFAALTRPLAVLCRLLLGGVIGAAATCKGPASLGQTLTGFGLPLPSCGEEDLSYATDEYLKELALTDPTAAAELLTKKTEWEEKKAAEVRLPERRSQCSRLFAPLRRFDCRPCRRRRRPKRPLPSTRRTSKQPRRSTRT